MPKPACVKCRMFFRVKKNGVTIEEGMPIDEVDPETGRRRWGPYKLWMADLWECIGCGAQITIGYGQVPVAEYFDKKCYKEAIQVYPPVATINDC